MKLSDKTGDLVGVVMNDEDKDLMALTSSGKMIRTNMDSIRKSGRNTSGVKIVNVEGKDKVVAISSCPKMVTEDDDETLIPDEI
jgi:DNA gyrase subunit A